MGMGAGLGAFAQGLAGGLKTMSDLQDAEQRRGLMAIQQKAAQQQVDMGDEQAAARKEAAGIIDGYNNGNTDLGFVKKNDGTYDPSDPKNLQRYYELSEKSAARMAVAHGQNPTEAIAKVRDLKQKGFAEKVTQASTLFDMGDYEAGTNVLKQVYPLYNDGKELVSVNPNAQDPSKLDIQYKSRGSDEILSTQMPAANIGKMVRLGLNAIDAANLDMANRKLQIDAEQLAALKAHYERSDKNEADKNIITQKHYEDWFKVQSRMAEASVMKAASDRDAVSLAKVESATRDALTQMTTLVGFNPKLDLKTAAPSDVAANLLAGDKLQAAAYIQQAGGWDKTGFKVSPATAAQIATEAYKPENLVKAYKTDFGAYVVKVGDKIVPVNLTDGKLEALKKAVGADKPAAAPGAPASAPAPAPARRGIATPGAAPGAPAADVGVTGLSELGLRRVASDPNNPNAGLAAARLRQIDADRAAAQRDRVYNDPTTDPSLYAQ